MEPVLVVVYSYTGTARRLADLVCSLKSLPMGVITDARPRTGGSGTLRCVLDSLLHRVPEIRYDGPAPEAFRAVMLVAPIWMYALAGPMRTFVRHYGIRLRRVGVVVTMNSGGALNAFREVEQCMGMATERTLACTAREVEEGACTGRLLEMADALAAPAPPRPAAFGNEAAPQATKVREQP